MLPRGQIPDFGRKVGVYAPNDKVDWRGRPGGPTRETENQHLGLVNHDFPAFDNKREICRMANRSVPDEGADDPATETEKSAGRAGPSALGMSLDSSVEGTPNDNTSERIGSTRDVMDQRLDAMIAIADATGTTLDAVVARLGTAPEAEWRGFTSTLADLIAARPPSAIPDLHRAHRRISEAMAATDEPDPDLIDAAAEIEGALLAARPVTVADAYRRLLCLAPTLASDLFAPELARLRAEIEALIGGEV